VTGCERIEEISDLSPRFRRNSATDRTEWKVERGMCVGGKGHVPE
jgi:hypothetical protein